MVIPSDNDNHKQPRLVGNPKRGSGGETQSVHMCVQLISIESAFGKQDVFSSLGSIQIMDSNRHRL